MKFVCVHIVSRRSLDMLNPKSGPTCALWTAVEDLLL